MKSDNTTEENPQFVYLDEADRCCRQAEDAFHREESNEIVMDSVLLAWRAVANYFAASHDELLVAFDTPHWYRQFEKAVMGFSDNPTPYQMCLAMLNVEEGRAKSFDSISEDTLESVLKVLRKNVKQLREKNIPRERIAAHQRFVRKIVLTIFIMFLLAYALISFWKREYRPWRWGDIHYQDITIISAKQEWGTLTIGSSVMGKPLTVAKQIFSSGLGTHARSEIHIELPTGAKRLRGLYGVDDETGGLGSVRFVIVIKGQKKFESPEMKGGAPAGNFEVNVEESKYITLRVTEGDDRSVSSDHADWLNLEVIR